MMKSLSIKSKLIILNAAVLLILLFIFLFNVKHNMLKNYKRVGKDFNLSTEHLFGIVLKDHMLNPINKETNDLLKIISDNRKLEKARIIDSNGFVKSSLDTNEINSVFFKIYPNEKNLNLDTLKTRIKWSVDENRRAYISPIFAEEACKKCHGNRDVIAFLNTQMNYTENLNEIRSTFDNILFSTIIVFILIFISLSFSLNQLIFKRLSKFSIAFNHIKNRNFNFRFYPKYVDEISEIENNFNSMVNELESSRTQNEELYLEKLKNIDKLINIGTFTAELAHEINNYSAIFYSRLDYLKNEFSSNENLAEYRDDIKVMIHQVESMSAITKSILKHSKNRKTEYENVSIKKIFGDIKKLFENILSRNNITLDISNLSDATLKVDTPQIEQVFMNLLTNSIDAIGKEGKIEVSGKFENNNFIMYFKDNGPGISAENINNIFMPFFTTKGDKQGTGLGLFIVKNILNKQNAEIETIPSEEGVVFKITFKEQNEEI